MVVKVAGVGRSFAGVAAYCLHDRRESRGSPSRRRPSRWSGPTPGISRRAGETGRPQ